MISTIELSSCQSFYENIEPIDKKTLLEEISEGHHEKVLAWLKSGGTLDDILDERLSLAFYCFNYLSASQLKEILDQLPEGSQLPEDALHFIMDDLKGEGIEKMEELLPELEKFNYSYDWIYRRIIEEPNFQWVDFFLTYPPKSLDLNLFIDERAFPIHPLNQMRLRAAQLAIWAKIAERVPALKPGSLLLDQAHAIIEKMENHPGIDVSMAQEQMDKIRQYYYFEGDPQYEKDCAFIVDAMTLEGVEKQVAAGFDLYAPIGPFCIIILGEIDGDIKWIELLEFFFDYKEHQLIDLMAKYSIVEKSV
jgi:hypothetical protein